MANELIAAIATGSSRTAIGIVRLSGPGACRCAGAVFTPMDGRPLEEHPPRKLVYGTLRDRSGQVIDQILCTWSPAGGSYTGEETAELQCHGSPMVLSMALEALFAQGARQAGPGEFTQRAFLNGCLDLTQAEAVMDLIDAETPAAVHHAAGQLSRALSRKIEGIYDALLDVMAHFHAVLDYPDEDLDPFTTETITQALAQSGRGLDGLLASYQNGQFLTRGVPCAIVGSPNVGKSTLLNALLGYERAIVTNVPGTTRDTVEERCMLGDVLLRLIDTAGLRDTADPVEQIGVERSRRAMEEAGLILVVLDRSQQPSGEELELLRQAQATASTILILSKGDLPAATIEPLPQPLPPVVELSAATGEGLSELGQAVAALFPQGAEEPGELLTNARQAEAAQRARASIARAEEALQLGVTPDALLTDVEAALTALGELMGKTMREDVTARIFQRFCVGK